MPPTWPIRQYLGSGFGQLASTTKLGADVPAGAREAQRVSPRVTTAPASLSAAAAALSAAAGACGWPPQATMPMLDTSAAAAIRKRACDMAYPTPIDAAAVWPVSCSLATARLLAIERIAHHEPGAADLAIDPQEVAGGPRFGAAGLRLRDDHERAALIREITGHDGFLGRPRLVEVGRLKRARHRVDERLLAGQRRPAGHDHHVPVGREARERVDVTVVDRLQVLAIELGDRRLVRGRGRGLSARALGDRCGEQRREERHHDCGAEPKPDCSVHHFSGTPS